MRKNIIYSVNNVYRAEYDKDYHEYIIYAHNSVIGRFKVDYQCKNGQFMMGTASSVIGLSCNQLVELRRLCIEAEANLGLGVDAPASKELTETSS